MKKYNSQYHRLSVNIYYTYGWLNGIYNQKLKEYELTPQQFSILRALKWYYPEYIAVNSLKETMPDLKSDTSRLVERLRAKGFVDRVACPNDRRKQHVILTEKGLELIDEIESQEDQWVKDIYKINPEEAELLNQLLDKIRTAETVADKC